MLVKKRTLELMYAAGNGFVRELIDKGVSPSDVITRRDDIRQAMQIAFQRSGDRSSGHDADNQITNHLEELQDLIETFGTFEPLEPHRRA